MEIQRINNSNTSFKGYIGSSVTGIINEAAKNSADDIVRHANINGEVIEASELKAIYNKRSFLFDKLDNFMKKFHPDTFLGIDTDGSFFIANSKVKKSESCYTIDLLPRKDGAINKKALKAEHLDTIAKWADKYIARTDPKAKDKYMFNELAKDKLKAAKSISIFAKLHNYFAARKLDKLAPEFGAEGGWRNKLEAARQEAITKKNLQKVNAQKAKEIEKENQKIAENIAKRKQKLFRLMHQ